jgi:hypothetical protein
MPGPPLEKTNGPAEAGPFLKGNSAMQNLHNPPDGKTIGVESDDRTFERALEAGIAEGRLEKPKRGFYGLPEASRDPFRRRFPNRVSATSRQVSANPDSFPPTPL